MKIVLFLYFCCTSYVFQSACIKSCFLLPRQVLSIFLHSFLPRLSYLPTWENLNRWQVLRKMQFIMHTQENKACKMLNIFLFILVQNNLPQSQIPSHKLIILHPWSKLGNEWNRIYKFRVHCSDNYAKNVPQQYL